MAEMKKSWAEEVEEEHEASGWKEQQQVAMLTAPAPLTDDSSSSDGGNGAMNQQQQQKKKKKKKKRSGRGKKVVAAIKQVCADGIVQGENLTGDTKNADVSERAAPLPVAIPAPWQPEQKNAADDDVADGNDDDGAWQTASASRRKGRGQGPPGYPLQGRGAAHYQQGRALQQRSPQGWSPGASSQGRGEGASFPPRPAFRNHHACAGPPPNPPIHHHTGGWGNPFPQGRGEDASFPPRGAPRNHHVLPPNPPIHHHTEGWVPGASSQHHAWGAHPPIQPSVEKPSPDSNVTSEQDCEGIPPQLLPPERPWAGINNTAPSDSDDDKEFPDAVGAPPSDSCSDDLPDDASDSDWMDGEDDCFDSDASEKSHDTEKKSKWFKEFFASMDSLSIEEVKEPGRQWHCPACQRGPGAVSWYQGLQALVAHAKTVRSKRVKLHQQFAKLVEKEVEFRGTIVGVESNIYGRWKGLKGQEGDETSLIVWPPMVIIQNTKLELDENEKWIGMGNSELLNYFSEYNPSKARHAYGPQGHRGLSVVIFAESPIGFFNSQRLDQHFKDERRGKQNWEARGKLLFQPGGSRILYGYYATPEDMKDFNRHAKGKTALKWEQRMLKEVVLTPMKQLDGEKRQLCALKLAVEKEREHSKALEKMVGVFARKFQAREEEVQVVRRRYVEQCEQYRTEIEDLEKMFEENLDQRRSERIVHEKEVRKLQEDFKQVCLERCEKLEQGLSNTQAAHKKEETARLKKLQSQMVKMSLKDSEDYEDRKRELEMQQHAKRKGFLQHQYQALLQFEKGLEEEKERLLEAYKSQLSGNKSKLLASYV